MGDTAETLDGQEEGRLNESKLDNDTILDQSGVVDKAVLDVQERINHIPGILPPQNPVIDYLPNVKSNFIFFTLSKTSERTFLYIQKTLNEEGLDMVYAKDDPDEITQKERWIVRIRPGKKQFSEISDNAKRCINFLANRQIQSKGQIFD